LNPRSISEIDDFITFLSSVSDDVPETYDQDKIKKNWLLYYYISRWAFVMRIYYVRCTSQLDLSNKCWELSKLAANKAANWRAHTGKYVENSDFVLKDDPQTERKTIREKIDAIVDSIIELLDLKSAEKRDPLLKKLAGVQDWLDANSLSNATLKMMAKGDYQNAAQALMLLEEEAQRMKYSDKLGEEYESQIKAKKIYAQACISEENYNNTISELRVLFLLTFIRFPKIAREIKIYEARAALRYNKLEDAQFAYKSAKALSEGVNSYQNGIFEGWLNLIEAQIALLKHKNAKDTEQDAEENSTLKELCPEFIRNIIQDGLWSVFDLKDGKELKLEDIKSKFINYRIEESVINRPKAEYLPLEAQRLFVLGQVELEQLKEEYDHDKYLNGVAYLLNAYSILLELGSKDKFIMSQIEPAYKKLIRINFENSRFDEERIKDILNNLNIEEVAKRNQLEQWTKALLKIITEQKLTSKEDCEEDFSGTLVRVIPPFVPSASNISLIKENELSPSWELKPNEDYSVIREGTVEKDGNKIYATLLSLNTHDEFSHEDHSIVIESSHELTKYTKGALMMIATALEKALKIHSLYKNSENGVIEDRQRLYDLSGPLTDILLDEATVEHKKRIQEFIRIFCEEWNKEHKEMLNMTFDTDLLVNYARHHDTGKAESPLIVLFKPGSLNDDEFTTMTSHPTDGAEKLYGLFGFDEIVKLELVHHIQEGNRRGYPWDLKGWDYQENINE
jgi:HD-GYP domain-containing protein (c-di-GMP phosphodiesterase class II)